jgi:hypothetical protein
VVALAGCGATATNSDGTTKVSTGPKSTASTLPKDSRTVQRLLAGDGRAGDNFGGAIWYNTFQKPIKPVYVATPQEAALSSDGTVAAIGAPGNAGDGKKGAGAVYVFADHDGTWSQVAKLTASDAAPYDALGWSVAISGDGHEVVAGAPYDDEGAIGDVGAAYFFRETDGHWAQIAKVRAANAAAYDGFGLSVGLSRDGTRAIVGATGHDRGFLKDAGAVYTFRGQTDSALWMETGALTPKAPSVSAAFGGAVAFSADGSTAVATELTHFDSKHKLHSGATLVFGSTDAWTTSKQLAIFKDPNRNKDGETDAYGVNAVLSDDGKIAAVASPDVNVGSAGGAGGAYLYSTRGDWRRPADNATLTLLPSAPVPFGYYGSSVALTADGSRLFIGVDGAGSDGQGAGELVRLARSPAGGAVRVTGRVPITAPNATNGRFGTAIALSADGATALGTAPWLTVSGAKARGSAYVLPFPKQ